MVETEKKKVSGWQRLKDKYQTIEQVDEKIKQATEKGCSKTYILILGYLKNGIKKKEEEASGKKEEPKEQV